MPLTAVPPARHVDPAGDVGFWRVVLQGRQGTVYSQGTFMLSVRFPPSYPTVPPIVRFETRIVHPNVDAYGKICSQLLGPNWADDGGARMPDVLRMARCCGPTASAFGATVSTYLLSIPAAYSATGAPDLMPSRVAGGFALRPSREREPSQRRTRPGFLGEWCVEQRVRISDEEEERTVASVESLRDCRTSDPLCIRRRAV